MKHKGQVRVPPHSPGELRRPAKPSAPRGRPGLILLERLLAHHGVRLGPAAIQRLWDYHRLLIGSNRDSDLTRLHAFDTIVLRHYADSLLVSRWIRGRPRPLLDLGSGAGFPGIPLKIMRPELHIILAEPRPRRVEFLRRAVHAVQLEGIEIFPHKVTSQSLTRRVGGCITRAFGSVQKTLPRLEGAMGRGGRVFFMKGPAGPAELDNPLPPGWELARQVPYAIPHSTQRRWLFEIIRVAPPVAGGRNNHTVA